MLKTKQLVNVMSFIVLFSFEQLIYEKNFFLIIDNEVDGTREKSQRILQFIGSRKPN